MSTFQKFQLWKSILIICRDGRRHYDGVTDARDAMFKEFCCYGRSYPIEGTRSCGHLEDKNPVCDDEDGILRL